MVALDSVLDTQMATQQTQQTRQVEAQIRQLAVVLEMDAQRTQSTQETRQVEASDQVLSTQETRQVEASDQVLSAQQSGLVSSARLDDDTAPRALSLIDLCRATGTRVSLP